MTITEVPRPRRALAAGLLALVVLAGCSSGDDPESTPTGSTAADDETTTTEQPSGPTDPPEESTSTTTTTEPPPAEPRPEAVAATLTAADMGTGWADYVAPDDDDAEEEEEEDTDDLGCAGQTGLLDGLGPTDTSAGEIIQLGDRTRFVRTTSRVFPDQAAADAFAAHLTTDAFAECRRLELQEGLEGLEPPSRVAAPVITQPSDTENGGLLLTYEVQGEDGTWSVGNGSSEHIFLVEGTTVIDFFVEQARLDDDPADLDDQVASAIEAGGALVISRVGAGG